MRSTPMSFGQGAEVLLVVRGDPDVAADGLARVLAEGPGRLVGLLAQALDEQLHPVRTVLDAGDAKAWVAGEDAVDDQRGDGVVNGPVGDQDAAEDVGVAEALERRAPTPG